MCGKGEQPIRSSLRLVSSSCRCLLQCGIGAAGKDFMHKVTTERIIELESQNYNGTANNVWC